MPQVKIDNSLFKNPLLKSSNHILVWVYLVCLTNPRPKKAIFNGQDIVLEPWQLITSRRNISKHTSIDNSTIQRILQYLEDVNMIDQQPSSSNRLITLHYRDMIKESEPRTEPQAKWGKRMPDWLSLVAIDISEPQYLRLLDMYPRKVVDDKLVDMDLYCAARWKRYVDYSAALIAWLRKDWVKKLSSRNYL